MAIVRAKCPNCNELIDIEENDFNVVCKFCGVPFMPSEGIANYQKHAAKLAHSLDVDTVEVNDSNIANYATLGLAALKDGNHEKCGFYADDILKRKPNSPEGLLLKAFFVSNNYSKEDGIGYYLGAYINSNDDEFRKLVLTTFKNEFVDYSYENFVFLFKEFHHNRIKLVEAYKQALMIASTSYINQPIMDDLNLSFKQVCEYLEAKPTKTFTKNNDEYALIDDVIITHIEDKVTKVVYLKAVSKNIEKFFNKKNEINTTYNFYVNELLVSFSSNGDIPELEEIVKSNTSYDVELIKQGCYVATCVYGSYDCKEVWVLRRYRDEDLYSHILGRLFIKVYYAISPTIVKVFGKNNTFQKLNKKILNRKVKALLKKGYSSEPYQDRNY